MLSRVARREGWATTALRLRDVCPALCGPVKGRAISFRGDGAQRQGEASGLTLTHRMCGSSFPLKCSRGGCSLCSQPEAEDTEFPPCSVVPFSLPAKVTLPGTAPRQPHPQPQRPFSLPSSFKPLPLPPLLSSPSLLEEGQVAASKGIPVTWPPPAPGPWFLLPFCGYAGSPSTWSSHPCTLPPRRTRFVLPTPLLRPHAPQCSVQMSPWSCA